MWDGGSNIDQIAAAIGVARGTVYYYRTRDGWPAHPDGRAADPHTLAFGRKLWYEGVPRLDIAAVLGIRLGTVDSWRKKYGWPSRSAGHSTPVWEAVYRELAVTARTNGTKPKNRREWVAALRNVFSEFHRTSPPPPPRVTPRWRCDCAQVRTTASCATCGRKAPAFK